MKKKTTKNTQIPLSEFIKKFTTFTPPPYMEKFLEFLDSGDIKRQHFDVPYRYGKSIINNDITCHKLLNLKGGETFAIVYSGGYKLFKCSEAKWGK